MVETCCRGNDYNTLQDVTPCRLVYYKPVHIGVKTAVAWDSPFIGVLAGGDVSQLTGIDGVDMWNAISRDLPSPRTKLLLNIDDHSGYSALRLGRHKYVNGECEKTDICNENAVCFLQAGAWFVALRYPHLPTSITEDLSNVSTSPEVAIFRLRFKVSYTCHVLKVTPIGWVQRAVTCSCVCSEPLPQKLTMGTAGDRKPPQRWTRSAPRPKLTR
jgi:hypothetical protein